MTDSTNKKPSLALFWWLFVIITVAGVAVSLWAPAYFMPQSFSSSMHLTIATMVIFSVAAAPVSAAVYAAAIYAIRTWGYHGDEAPPAGPAMRENTKVVGLWLLTSTVLAVFLLVWGLGALAADNSSTGKDPLVVNVTGQQWLWSFSYPGTHVESNVLYLPVNREVEFRITSKDVTHGFWIVNMGVQVDANPGTITTIHTTPSRMGLFNIRCEQFCGLNHSFMDTDGHVVTSQDFNSWLASQPQRA
ncbi:MAG: cytochrome c oxidase subunit II [Acidimicrobiales bacterium]